MTLRQYWLLSLSAVIAGITAWTMFRIDHPLGQEY